MANLSFSAESWTWFSIVMFFATCRYASRLLLFKTPWRFQFDDWAMMLALASYTAMIVAINIEVQHSSNLLPPNFQYKNMSPVERADREFGSKMVLVVETSQCVCVWLVKACILALYVRVTVAYKENIAIKAIAAYVAVSFIVMEILYWGVWCQPVQQYWAVPSKNPQCTAATNHLITNAVFNISSDVLMIGVALQIIIRSMLPVQKKLILGGIFGLGVFVIISAALNKAFSFTDPWGLAWTRWYVRESSTALLVANLPLTWNLWRRIFALAPFHRKGTNDASSTSPELPSQSGDSARDPPSRRSGEWLEIIEGHSPDLESGQRQWKKTDVERSQSQSSNASSSRHHNQRTDSFLGLKFCTEQKL